MIPSGELLGQVLLEEGRAVESMLAFQTALETAPGRASSLLGLARAAELAGESERATRAYSRLHANWHSADPDIPGREETSDYIEANRLGAATNRGMSNGGGRRKMKLTNSDENSP